MQYGNVPGVDKRISRLVQGTTALESLDKSTGFDLLDAVFEGGCNTFDTAHVYGQGKIERAFGEWMNSPGVRDQLVIIDKGAHHSVDRKRVTPFDITADIHDSLARLKTDYIDIYLLHRDDESQPVGPIVEVLNEHKAAGRIKVFGGSNWSTQRIQAANDYAEAHGLTPFTISSPNFSLADQVQAPWDGCMSISGPKNAEARAWYAAHKMPLFTWSSVAGGFFSGRFRRDNLDTFETYMDKLCVTSYASEDNFQRLERVQTLAHEMGLTTNQIAVAYVLNYPLDIFALVGSATPGEFQANVDAMNVKLDDATMAWLDLRGERPLP